MFYEQSIPAPAAGVYTNGKTVKTVTGQYIAKAHLTRRQRAKLAAQASKGAVNIYPLTARQAALVARVPRLDVTVARRNGNGIKFRNGRSAGEALADHITRSSAAERLEAARIIGPAELWDSMISPVISDERTATETNSTA
jgi:hypothetical protein